MRRKKKRAPLGYLKRGNRFYNNFSFKGFDTEESWRT
jgi:hypothetical protein